MSIFNSPVDKKHRFCEFHVSAVNVYVISQSDCSFFLSARYTNSYKLAGRSQVLYSTILLQTNFANFYEFRRRWHEPSKPPENLLEARLHENSWLPKPHERVHQPPAESRNLIVTDLVPLLFVKSEDTRNPRNCSSESCHSSDWSVKSPKISRLTCDSSLPLSPLCKKPQKLTWSASSKTPISAPSTQRGSPSCQRTSNWHEESEESVLRFLTEKSQKAIFMATHLINIHMAKIYPYYLKIVAPFASANTFTALTLDDSLCFQILWKLRCYPV